MRKCKHKTVIPVWLQAIGGSYRCYKCGALGVRPLGPSNDSGEAVRIEILAAEIGQSPEAWARFMDLDAAIERDLRRVSGRDSTWAGLGATSPTAGHLDVKGGPNWTDGQLGDYLAGWLARDVSGDAGDAFTWSWDPSRPVAGQFEEWVARTDRQIEAMEDDAAAQFFDGDVEAMKAYMNGDAGAAIDGLLEDSEAARRDAKERQAALDAARDRPIGAPDALDDEAFDPVDGRFDTTDEILPDEVAK